MGILSGNLFAGAVVFSLCICHSEVCFDGSNSHRLRSLSKCVGDWLIGASLHRKFL